MKRQIQLSQLSKEVQAKVRAELGSTKGAYWNKQGDFQKEYQQIWKDFIPAEGKAAKAPAELVRALSGLYWDCYQNGWGNNKLYEASLLAQKEPLFKSFYKTRQLEGVVEAILEIQEAFDNPSAGGRLTEELYDEEEDESEFQPDNEAIEAFSARVIEPHFDNLADAIIQYAHKELYPSK